MSMRTRPVTGWLTLVFAFVALAAQSASAQPTPVDQAVIDDLVAANRILAQEQVLDAYGHVSVRHPANPQRFLMGRNLAPALVTADDIVEYDLDGNAYGAKPGFTHFLERFIHAEIYRARGDVNAVVHSHSALVIPFANTPIQMRPMFHVSSFLAPNVPVFEIRKAAPGPTNMLIGNAALGKALAETLGPNAVALMRGHGEVVVAPSLPLVVFRAVYTDVNAKMQAQAIAAGGPIVFLDAEEAALAANVLDQVHTRAWELWKRKVAK
jgi:ribulose-5-phosphate 4-epimerase/fuculose-1-phosphate aldolase